MREMPAGWLFGISGCCIFNLAEPLYVFGFRNFSIASTVFDILSLTLNFEVEHIKQLPIIAKDGKHVENVVAENIQYSRTDWDSFEESQCFRRHPLI